MSVFTARFGGQAGFSQQELDVLERLEEHVRVFRRGSVIANENESSRDLWAVHEGWLHSSIHLGNGARQILRFFSTGDLAGLPLLTYQYSPETITAITDVRLACFSREKLIGLFDDHPRLAKLILAHSIEHKIALVDRLASIGRTPARARVASLICEFYYRTQAIQGVPPDCILIPLTQEDIGDATGLTAVHVNRMLRSLAEDGTIQRNGNHIRVLNPVQLSTIADFTQRLASRNQILLFSAHPLRG